jgi:hypothetical protein
VGVRRRDVATIYDTNEIEKKEHSAKSDRRGFEVEPTRIPRDTARTEARLARGEPERAALPALLRHSLNEGLNEDTFSLTR